MRNKQIYIGITFCTTLIFVSAILLTFHYNEWEKSKAKSNNNNNKVQLHMIRDNSLSTKVFDYEKNATIAAIGDILIHSQIYRDAYNGTDYDFNPVFSTIKPYLEKPDFLIANQESLPAGEEFGLSGYPLFNSPSDIVEALQNAGVDAISNANNHTLDQGIKALKHSIAYYEKIGMPYSGAFKSVKDQKTIRTFVVKDISFALLSYTYGTNGIPVPQGNEYAVNLLNPSLMIDEIQRAKQLGVDLIVLSLHWGDEYQRYPSDEQKKLAKILAEAGADIIFGHHSHVVQPIEKLTLPNGREAVIVYSLGNFLSAQKHNYKDIGGIVTVEVQKKGTVISYPSITFEPTFVTEKNYRNYQILPLQSAYNQGLVQYSEGEIISHVKGH